MYVSNMIGNTGKPVVNQFVITEGNKTWFQSYDTLIAVIITGQVFLDINKWDYSQTTGKYRNRFLSETKKETQAKINSGEYLMRNLNKRKGSRIMIEGVADE